MQLRGLLLVCVGACAGRTADNVSLVDGGSTPDAALLGAPCVPRLEQDPDFSGFVGAELNLDMDSDASDPSGATVCLVNHFQGRISCPYGQGALGATPSGAGHCETPGGISVRVAVRPQCADRRPADAVYYSCRCANVAGQTDDGDAYCACPAAMDCVQTFSPIGGDDHLSGAYCVRTGTDYDAADCSETCDVAQANCP
jgi:hypothetical protein